MNLGSENMQIQIKAVCNELVSIFATTGPTLTAAVAITDAYKSRCGSSNFQRFDYKSRSKYLNKFSFEMSRNLSGNIMSGLKQNSNSKFKTKILLIELIAIITSLSLHIVTLSLPQQGLCREKPRMETSDWFRRFALPVKTKLEIFPTFTIPNLDVSGGNGGLYAATKLSFPIEIHFDKIGWLPRLRNIISNFIYPQSGNNFVERFKRGLGSESADSEMWPQQRGRKFPFQNQTINNIVDTDVDVSHPGGERATLLPFIVKTLDGIGKNGRSCLQRAICEIHEDSLMGYGLFGEIIQLVFSVSKSRYAKTRHLADFLEAEIIGKGHSKSDCKYYNKRCETSIFKWHHKSILKANNNY